MRCLLYQFLGRGVSQREVTVRQAGTAKGDGTPVAAVVSIPVITFIASLAGLTGA